MQQAKLDSDPLQVLRERQAAQQVDLTVGEPRLHPLLQQLQNILDANDHKKSIKAKLHQPYLERLGGLSEAHQSAGKADHSNGSLGRLGDVKQVVEQRLVLMVGKQVELIQDEQHRAAATAITWCETQTATVGNTQSINHTFMVFN